MSDFPQPPRVAEPRFDDWLFRFHKFVVDGGLSSSQSSAAPAATPTSHSSLSGLNTSEYTHLTAINAGDLTDGGDSALHFHSSDRNRSNHTGTQAASTISDFNAAVLAAMSLSSSVLESQVFGA